MEQSGKGQRARLSSVRLFKILIRYFSVRKGYQDVCMVYDGTGSGFNELVWVPIFLLPSVNTLLRDTSQMSCMVDLDIG